MTNDNAKTPIDTTLRRTPPAAFERQREAIARVPDGDLIPINVDILAAIGTARGAARKVTALLPDIRRVLPGHDPACFESLDDVALACAYATSQHTLAQNPPEVLAEVASNAVRMRDLLVTDAEGLTKRKLIDASALAGVDGSIAYRAIAHDLILLATLLRSVLPTLGQRITSTAAELDEADEIATKLFDHVSLREDSQVATEASKTRQRAFTLLVKTYEEVRRALYYVRWHEDDIEQIAPSLYAGRNNRKKKEPMSDAAPSVKVSPEPDVTAATRAPLDEDAVQVAEPIEEPAFVGMPGGSPLT